MNTPMQPTLYLGLYEESKKVDGTQYRAMIGSLLYLTMCRPDIMFNVFSMCKISKRPRGNEIRRGSK